MQKKRGFTAKSVTVFEECAINLEDIEKRFNAT